jgi:excisionase family DNA binding protein
MEEINLSEGTIRKLADRIAENIKKNEPQNNKTKLYTITELERVLKVHRQTIVRRFNSGELKCTRQGKKMFVTQEDLEKYLAKSKVI